MGRVMRHLTKHRRTGALAAWAILALTVSFRVLAQPAGGADSDAIRRAVTRFYAALETGDADALRSLIWASSVSQSQQAGREEVVQLIVAHKRLERAALARWPEQGGRLRAGFEMITGELDRKALETARVVMEDVNKARIFAAGETGNLRLVRPDAQWQVCIDMIERELDDDTVISINRPDTIVRIRLDRFRWMSAAIRDVAAKIEAGDFAAVTDAETALHTRWNEITIEVNRRRTLMWERRFGR